MGWNGDIRRAIVGAGQEGPRDGLPRARGPDRVLGRQLVIPTASEHPVAAHKWIDFVLDPANAGKEMNYHQYPVPVEGITGVDPKLADDPVINIPDEKIQGYESRSRPPRACSSATGSTRSSRPPDDGGGRRHLRGPAARSGGRVAGALLGLALLGGADRPLHAARHARPRAARGRRAAARLRAAVRARGRRHPAPDRRRPRRAQSYPFQLAFPSLAYYCAFFVVPLCFLLLFAVATPRRLRRRRVRLRPQELRGGPGPALHRRLPAHAAHRGDRHAADRSSSATRSPTGSPATRPSAGAACSWR